MAPRFKQLLFQTYDDDEGASAFIGFSSDPSDLMFTFRDELRNKIQEFTGFSYRINVHGPWDVIDVYIRFFDGEDEETVNAFYSKPEPGCLSWLFGSRQYRNYVAGEAKVRPLIKIKITTSHDYPCIIIESSTLSSDAITHLIQEVTSDLDVKITKGNFPYSMDAILMSNREFDIDDGK